MTVQKAYLAEPQTLSGDATILAILDGDKPVVRLDRTYFHPQGGGQKGDRGQIGNAIVLDTKHAEGGEVDHFVVSTEGLVIGQIYPIAIDAASRRINAANHTAGHLIAALVDEEFPGIKGVQGHHWPSEARVEFEGAVTDEIIAGVGAFLQSALDKAVAEAWQITMCGDPFVNRSVKVGNADVPCGGTHVAHLGQIKKITVKAVKRKGERLRVTYDTEINDSAFEGAQ